MSIRCTGMRPTYEELEQIIEEQRKLIEEQSKLIETIGLLKKKIVELEERLGRNSNNSSKPPSTDHKKNKTAPRGGAKKGHVGYFRKRLPESQVTTKVVVPLDQCPHCQSAKLYTTLPAIFQQIELPAMQPLVTQIECTRATCGSCHKKCTAPFPEQYNKTAFGPRLTAFIGICSSVYRLSKRTIQNLLRTVCNIDVALGSLPTVEQRVSEALKHSYEEIFQRVDQAKVGYIDETTFRQQAKTHYVWTITTRSDCFMRTLPTRGLSSLNLIRPRTHSQITVSDRYSVYAYAKHQYCLAHLRRDFQKFAERKGLDGELGRRALFELQDIFVACRFSCRRTMQRQVGYRKRRLKEILYEAFANGTDTFSRFAERIIDSFPQFFLFTRYPECESTNNAAERTLRHIVLWRKTSYGTQSATGSRFLERTISVWMTLKKQGRNAFSFFYLAYRSTFDPACSLPNI